MVATPRTQSGGWLRERAIKFLCNGRGVLGDSLVSFMRWRVRIYRVFTRRSLHPPLIQNCQWVRLTEHS
jgi:hypothetical protein